MPQELSVSYQAVKTKVHRLMDAVVEGAKTEGDIAECIARWWTLVQPADRAGREEIPPNRAGTVERHPESHCHDPARSGRI